MSNTAIAEVLKRAAAEPEYRDLLFRDAAQALAGFDLTSEEQMALSRLTPETFSTLTRDLDQRISMGIVWGDLLGRGQ